MIKIKEWWKTTQVYIWYYKLFYNIEIETNWNKVKQQLNSKMEETNQVDPESVYPKPEPSSIPISTSMINSIGNSSIVATSAGTINGVPTKLENVLSLILDHNSNLIDKIGSAEETAKKLDPTYTSVLSNPTPIKNDSLGILDKITNYLQISKDLVDSFESVTNFIKKQI